MANIDDFFSRSRPDPQDQEVGIGGFTAMVRIRESYNLSSEVPTTPVEDGSFVNDHIILKPLVLRIEGDVSNVFIRQSPGAREFLRAQAEIGNLSGQFAPERTQSQASKVATLRSDLDSAKRAAGSVIDAGTQAIDYFGNRDTSSKGLQEQFIEAMEALHFGRQVIAIDMPYRRHEGMVITSFEAVTNNEEDSTGFTITAQKIQLAELQFVSVARPAAGVGGQLDPQADKGAQEGEDVPRSLLSNLFGD